MEFNPRNCINLVEVTKLFRQAMVAAGDNLDITALAQMQEHLALLDRVCAAELAGERAFNNVVGNHTKTNSLLIELAETQRKTVVFETMNPGEDYKQVSKRLDSTFEF